MGQLETVARCGTGWIISRFFVARKREPIIDKLPIDNSVRKWYTENRQAEEGPHMQKLANYVGYLTGAKAVWVKNSEYVGYRQ